MPIETVRKNTDKGKQMMLSGRRRVTLPARRLKGERSLVQRWKLDSSRFLRVVILIDVIISLSSRFQFPRVRAFLCPTQVKTSLDTRLKGHEFFPSFTPFVDER